MEKLLFGLNETITKVETLTEELERNERNQMALRDRKESTLASLELNERALSTLMILFEKLNDIGLSALDGLIENTLTLMYPHRNYEVSHRIKESRGANQLTFILTEHKDGRKIRSDIRTSTGGSVRALSGLTSILYYLMKLKAEPILIIDEGLSQVDSNAIEPMFQMLKMFGDQEFTFIIVTHDSRFKPYLDKEYRINLDGTSSLIGD